MAGDILLTGLSGLTAFRNVLNTTSHNIANATTEGYSRQTVELDARNPQLTGAGYIGSGVQSTSVSRLYDSFLGAQFRSSSSAVSELDTYAGLARQIDGVLADPNTGLSVSLQAFFNAAQDVSDDPTSIAARQVLLSEGEVIESRFGTLDDLLSSLTSQVNNTLQEVVSEINSFASGVAQLNAEIVSASGATGGSLPNDLLDQRDLLIDKISESVNVSTSEQEDGSLNVFIGSGQALVLGETSNLLLVQPTADPAVKDIAFSQAGGNLVVTRFMTGGELGGALRFRDEMLDPAIDNLGQIAIAFSAAVNAQHTNGLDLNGAQGANFFNQPTVGVTPAVGNTGTLDVTFDPATTANLTGSDYTVAVDSLGAYTITRSSDSIVVGAGSIPVATQPTIDGLNFDLSSLANDDTYTVTPPQVADVIDSFSMGIADPREIAAAQAVLSSVTPSNTGSGQLSSISVNLDSSPTLLSAGNSVTLTYDSTNQRYDVSVSGVVATPATIAYDPANDNGNVAQVSIAGFGTVSFVLSGVPQNSDSLVLTDNIGGVGDNRNANLLSDLQTSLSMAGGTASFQDSYGQLIADVGRRTQSAESNGLAQNALLAHTQASKDAISGVSLDEEAANLIRFQQAYQAASQVVLTSRTIFDTLLSAFR